MRFTIQIMMMGFILGGALPVMADHEPGHAQHAQEAQKQGLTVFEEAVGTSVVVAPSQAVVEVHGVVCSFCAFGIEQKLSRLPFLDTSKFTRGLFIDIEAHRLTLALAPDQPMDLSSLYRAIRDAGYEPIRVHWRVTGAVDRQDDHVRLTDALGGVFRVTGSGTQLSPVAAAVTVQVHLDGSAIPSLIEGEPIPVVFDRLVNSD